jgi:hypothetical protein
MTLDLNATYTIAGWSDGIAWRLRGYVETADEDTEWSGYKVVDMTRVEAVMVGDDTVHNVDVEDLTELPADAYCHECGQVGCGWDVRADC